MKLTKRWIDYAGLCGFTIWVAAYAVFITAPSLGHPSPQIDYGPLWHALEANRLRPNDADILSNLGFCLASAGYINEAIDAYQSAMDLAPRDSKAYVNMGALCLSAKCYNIAIIYFATALDVNPSDAHAKTALALAYNNLAWELATRSTH